MSLENRVASAEVLIALEPEELGAVLLMEVRELDRLETVSAREVGYLVWQHRIPTGVRPLDILQPILDQRGAANWPASAIPQVQMALQEAWGWLVCSVLVVQHPIDTTRLILTRRGRALATEQAVHDFREDGILPVGLLHPRIAADVRAHFMRGKYDTAVFEAFREIEIALREAVPGDPKRTVQSSNRQAPQPKLGHRAERARRRSCPVQWRRRNDEESRQPPAVAARAG